MIVLKPKKASSLEIIHWQDYDVYYVLLDGMEIEMEERLLCFTTSENDEWSHNTPPSSQSLPSKKYEVG